MNAPDDDHDGEMTADWPRTEPGPSSANGEATRVVPKTPQQGAPPPPPAPTAPPPPMWPPQAGQWDPRWQTTPGPGSPPPGAWPPPVPPGPYPPGYPPGSYPPVAPNPPRGRRWGLLAIGALIVVVIAVGVPVFVTRGSDSSTPIAARSTTSAAASTSASAPSPTAAAIVQPTALKGLLASVADVTQIANNAMMTPTLTQDSPILGVHVDPFACTGAVMTAMHATYIVPYTAFSVQLLNNGPQHIDVIQALASFPREADAKAFVDREFEDWQSCDNTDVIVSVDGRYGGPPQRGRVTNVANTEGTNSILISPPSGIEGRQCQHAMSARKNVVVDVRVCAPSVGSMGRDLDRVIGEKITGQR